MAWEDANKAGKAEVKLLGNVSIPYKDDNGNINRFEVEWDNDITFDGGEYTISYQKSEDSVSSTGGMFSASNSKLTVTKQMLK